MIVKIDWISFSLSWSENNGREGEYLLENISRKLDELSIDMADALDLKCEWEMTNGRAPYAEGLRHKESGITLFRHRNLQHCLFEISGKGCEWLYRKGNLFLVMNSAINRMTRIDIACDMETETKPTDFVSMRGEGRFKAHSEFVSESGETCYVGSRTSNRYARVYRYNPPHERSHLLRSEFVIKAEDCRITAEAIFSNGLESVAIGLGEKFAWNHPSWEKSLAEPANIATWRPERREGKTLFWLADTIAPLLVRLHTEGTIDIHEWLATHVFPDLGFTATS